MSPTIGVLVGDVAILFLLVFGHIQYPIWMGSLLAGTTALFVGAFWRVYHLKKLTAIKNAATRAD